VWRRLSATAGLRYTRDRKTIDNRGGLYPASGMLAPLPGTDYAYTDSISHASWTPKLVLDVALRPNALAYLSASRGFKSGGFNLTSPVPGRGFAPEWAWSYEAGVKGTFADGRASLSAAAFHTDYDDLQVQITIRPGLVDISNAARATIRGFELEGAVRVGAGVRLGGHLAWLDARYDEYVAVGVGGVTGDVAGRRLSNAPEWSGRAWLEWSAPAYRGTTASLRLDSRFQDTVFFTPFNDGVQRQSPYGLLDASLELGSRHLAVGLYGKNLTNEGYITGTFSSPPPAIGGRPGEPRLVGVQLTLRR
jgi:iron complex outermembrane receptor protein